MHRNIFRIARAVVSMIYLNVIREKNYLIYQFYSSAQCKIRFGSNLMSDS